MSKDDSNCFQDLFSGPLARQGELCKLLPVTVNGSRRYAAPEKLPVLVLSSRKVMVDDSLQTRTVLLLPGNIDPPEPGDLIDFDGRKRELSQVRLCRSLSGRITAIECTVY